VKEELEDMKGVIRIRISK